MTVQEAKDFLVAQATRQAAIDGVSLSDLEKRMLYFTEGEDAVENPIELNDEFEEQYDNDEYENKMSQIFKNAYRRLEKDDPIAMAKWKECLRFLRQGDHYILLFCGAPPGTGIFSRLFGAFKSGRKEGEK